MNWNKFYQGQRALPNGEGDHGVAEQRMLPKRSTLITPTIFQRRSRDLAYKPCWVAPTLRSGDRSRRGCQSRTTKVLHQSRRRGRGSLAPREQTDSDQLS